jgi:hypothetical protein
MTADTMSTTAREPEYGARRLIHRPTSWEHYLLDAPGSGEEHFVLAGSLPAGHPLPDGGPGRFHEPQHLAGELREIGEFVAHQYFGVPRERVGAFSRLVLAVTDVAAWRVVGPRPPRVTTCLAVRPRPAAGRVPRGLGFDVEVSVGDVPGCAGEGELLFPAPAQQRGRIAHGRRAVRAARAREAAPEDAVLPVAPGEVGRRSPAAVLLGEPALSAQGRLTTWVLPRAGWPAADAPGDGAADGLLLEALRQASVLTAGRAFGYDAALALVADWDVRFRGPAQAGPPVRCVAVPGLLDKDADGRPSVPVTLTLTQRQRTVAQARTRVVQDL